jgi:hypothetical protein
MLAAQHCTLALRLPSYPLPVQVASIGGAGTGRLAPGTPATLPATSGLKGSLEAGGSAQLLPTFEGDLPEQAAGEGQARTHSLHDLCESDGHTTSAELSASGIELRF